MLGYLILLFIILPLSELYLLMTLADATSPIIAFGLVIFTGILGGWLARQQGWQVYSKIQSEFAAARIPKESLMDGGMILVAGALLVTPGVMTDLFGFSLLFPPCRKLYRGWLANWMKGKFNIQTFGQGGFGGNSNTVDSPHWQPGNPDDVIDSHVVNRADDPAVDE